LASSTTMMVLRPRRNSRTSILFMASSTRTRSEYCSSLPSSKANKTENRESYSVFGKQSSARQFFTTLQELEQDGGLAHSGGAINAWKPTPHSSRWPGMISLLRGFGFHTENGIGSRAERILPDAIRFVEQASTPCADDFHFGGPSLLPSRRVCESAHRETLA